MGLVAAKYFDRHDWRPTMSQRQRSKWMSYRRIREEDFGKKICATSALSIMRILAHHDPTLVFKGGAGNLQVRHLLHQLPDLQALRGVQEVRPGLLQARRQGNILPGERVRRL